MYIPLSSNFFKAAPRVADAPVIPVIVQHIASTALIDSFIEFS